MRIFRPWSEPLTTSAREQTLRLIPLLLYLAMIFLVSSIPGTRLPRVADDRIEHAFEYFGLGLMLLFALAPRVDYRLRGRHAFLSVVVAMIWAASDEFHQRFVPNRDSSLKDLCFDFLGVSVAALVIFLGTRRVSRR